ncbi:hypothetical protein ANN_13730 [Periplaneta americana]|uniref:exodeoxyribonuclease III n=1 Tax=Periplaneta americana TaxID=6978 RepID=A0ABQ8SVV2_PERAM|nr:hypothetical protein ANN_13730 [Periplaneta americana]
MISRNKSDQPAWSKLVAGTLPARRSVLQMDVNNHDPAEREHNISQQLEVDISKNNISSNTTETKATASTSSVNKEDVSEVMDLSVNSSTITTETTSDKIPEDGTPPHPNTASAQNIPSTHDVKVKVSTQTASQDTKESMPVDHVNDLPISTANQEHGTDDSYDAMFPDTLMESETTDLIIRPYLKRQFYYYKMHLCLCILFLMALPLNVVATLNVNLLRSRSKQQQLTRFINDNDIDIFLLQEINVDNMHFLGPRFHAIYNPGENQRGTAIVYRSSIEIKQFEIHPSGRITTLLTNDNTLYVNVYLPYGSNKRAEREHFITHELLYYVRHNFDHLFFGGDFNCVLHAKDQTGEYNPSIALDRMILQLGLYDVWEKLHGNNIRFTYHNLNAASRIDRIYVNAASTDKLKTVSTMPFSFTDHDCVMLKVEKLHHVPKIGKSYWKLNSQLLRDDKTTEDFKFFWEAVTDRVRRSSSNILHKWTYIVKPANQQFFKSQGIQRVRTARNKLRYHYELLQNIYQQQCDGKDVFKHMQAAKRRLDLLQERVLQGSLTRSTNSSIIAEEKAALFHIATEKNKGQTKFIHQLKTTDNQNITGTPLILEEAFKYFQARFRHRVHSEQINITITSVYNVNFLIRSGRRFGSYFKIPHIPSSWKWETYALINGIIMTEERKYMYHIVPTPQCNKCGTIDTISHRLTRCSDLTRGILAMGSATAK